MDQGNDLRKEDPCIVDSIEYAFDLAIQVVKPFIEERNVVPFNGNKKTASADAGPSFSEKRAR